MPHAAAIPAPSVRVIARRNLALALLVIAGVVNYFDRSALSIANPLIRHDLHLSVPRMGLLLSAFAWMYGLAQIPGGLLVDRYGARRTLGIGLVLWSLAQVASSVCATLPQLMAARVALGAGEAPMYTGGTRVCADWWSERERTLPIAIFNSSASLGPAIAPIALTALMAAYGWRTGFAAIGILGFLIAIAWSLLYREPHDLALSPDERAAIGAADPAPQTGTVPPQSLARIARLLRHRSCWGMILGFFGVIYMTWLFATWLPGYLELQRHLNFARAGLLTTIPLTAGFLGALLAGFAVNALVRRGTSPETACRWLVVAAMLATGAATLAGAVVGGVAASVALISLGVFAANLASSAGWALGAVMVAPEDVASLEAIQNVGGSLGGALAPIVTGIAVGTGGSFVAAFAIAAAICVVTAAIYATMTRARIPPAGGGLSGSAQE